MVGSFKEHQIDKKEIPVNIRKDIKAYCRAVRKERIARARANNYNSRHPNRKEKSVVTKWAFIESQLFNKIVNEWNKYFCPAVGTEVGYLRYTSEHIYVECWGKIISIEDDGPWGKVKIKTRNNRIVERTRNNIYHDHAFDWSSVFHEMNLA